MKTSTIVFAVVFSAVATVWSAGPEGSSAPSNNVSEAAGRAPEAAGPIQLPDTIRQFVWDLRRAAIERWFHDAYFAASDESEDLLTDRPGDEWWNDALTEPQRCAVVEAQTPEGGVGAAASGRGTAVSMAMVDGNYEIEAAWSGPSGPERYRIRGNRAEVEQWAAQLPQPLKRAVRRQLASTDLDDVGW